MNNLFCQARENMVNNQLIDRGIKDTFILDAFRTVPRHEFVSKEYIGDAYKDSPLPIGEKQTISQPYMVALMTAQLGLTGKERVLEVGTGSGYQTAVLAELAQKVFSIERLASLYETAKTHLKSLGYTNIETKVADGSLGWSEHAPYDSIIVTAAAPEIPASLIPQLKVGGKLVIPIGERFSQSLIVSTKHEDEVETKIICGCIFVPLVGELGWKEEND